MPYLRSAPSVFFEHSELRGLVAEFSERVRRDQRVRAAMDRLIGNRWLDAEQAAETFLSATLFLEACPEVDAGFLERAVHVLGPAEINALAEIMLDCALVAFPMQSAGAIFEVANMLAEAIKAAAASDKRERRHQLMKLHSRLSAGTLMNRF
jgi:hypothetical protein